MLDYILAIDAGTTGVRACGFSAKDLTLIYSSYKEISISYPAANSVEQNATEIIDKIKACIKEVCKHIDGSCLAIGITNQRETILCWDKDSLKPVYNAIVWQDKRTTDYCQQLAEDPQISKLIRNKTGLVIDPYFSATKIKWLLQNLNLNPSKIRIGTVDSWIIENLRQPFSGTHISDYSNASRTMLFDIHNLNWSPELLEIFGIPKEILPETVPSGYHFGTIDKNLSESLGFKNPPKILSVLGDQQSALFGQGCFSKSLVKATFGTGSFVLMNVGSEPPSSPEGLLTTIAWAIKEPSVTYALEGSNLVSGAAIKWMRDSLGLIQNSQELEPLALSVPDAGQVCFVPAFVGLGSPFWDPSARGFITGITQGTTKAHLARALVEALVFQVKDITEAMKNYAITPTKVRVDGGASKMNLLCQLLADTLEIPVQRPLITEATALGTAALSGVMLDLWDLQALSNILAPATNFTPEPNNYLKTKYAFWQKCITRAKQS